MLGGNFLAKITVDHGETFCSEMNTFSIGDERTLMILSECTSLDQDVLTWNIELNHS
jgi:hypothetical protein